MFPVFPGTRVSPWLNNTLANAVRMIECVFERVCVRGRESGLEWQCDSGESIAIPVISDSQAARAVARRVAEGGAHTGWSAAWLINIYARSDMFVQVHPRGFVLHGDT